MKTSLADRTKGVADDYMRGWRRIARAYAVDLAASLLLLLFAARLWGVVTAGGPETDWAIHLHAAVDRFTPTGLWDSYRNAASSAFAALSEPRGGDALSNLFVALRLLSGVLLAAPATLVVIWQQTDTLSDWVTLIGFGTIMAGTFLVLVAGRWFSFTRVLIAAVGSPLATIGLFWALQQSLLNMTDSIGWFAVIAPWCLLCPVACTLYWVVLPHAEHGATAAVLLAAGRLRLGSGSRRHHRIAAHAAPAPLPRK